MLVELAWAVRSMSPMKFQLGFRDGTTGAMMVIIAVVGANAKYHFCPTEEVSPYVGGQVNYAYLTSTAWEHHDDGMLWGPLVGVAFKCADKTSLFVEYQWQLYCGEVRGFINESSSILVGMSLGLLTKK